MFDFCDDVTEFVKEWDAVYERAMAHIRYCEQCQDALRGAIDNAVVDVLLRDDMTIQELALEILKTGPENLWNP